MGYYRPGAHDNEPAANVAASSVSDTIASTELDQKTATDVAANFAIQTQMPVAANVANLSTSLQAKQEIAQSDDTVIAKPQIVQPTADNRTITHYTAQTGDTVQSIATAHNLSPQTVKWANNLQSDAIEAGRDIVVLPVDGMLYTTKDGDSAQSIADQLKTQPERIVSFNDLETTGIRGGVQLIIPGGQKPADPAPVPAAATRSVGNGQTTGSFDSTAGLANASASVGNKYAFGNCTWYAYERRAQLGRPVGSFWGNASTWAANARAAGFTVNGTPAPGAIMQNGGGYAGYGHVAIVETVNGDSFTISEMNYAGFNVVSSRTIPMSQAGNYNFIH